MENKKSREANNLLNVIVEYSLKAYDLSLNNLQLGYNDFFW